MSGRNSAVFRPGWLQTGFALALSMFSTMGAGACPLCYEAARQMMTEGVRLDSADRAVLAKRDVGDGALRVVAVVKGEAAVGEKLAEPVAEYTDATGAQEPYLLITSQSASQWTSLGAAPLIYAGWLRQIVATREIAGERPKRLWPLTAATADALSYEGWRQRVDLVLPYLEDPNPLVARLAWGELARAPYRAMDVARSQIDAAKVTSWLDDPKLAPRRAAYLMLLGFIGGPEDARRLDARLDKALAVHDAKDLAALIAAALELGGPSRVEWIEARMFADRSRTMPEIEAALLALNVLGDANGSVPRARVIEAYRDFIRRRPAMAGFVAPQLADWNYWDAAADYSALVKANATMDPASQMAIGLYLKRAAGAGIVLQ
jgi:hypothetical protein